MAIANLNNAPFKVLDGNDNIVIVDILQSKRGGTTLDVEGVAEPYLKAGHVIIKDPATGDYKPMPVADGAYGTLPLEHEYAGILIATIPTDRPFAAIMEKGKVNVNASPFPLDTILADLKAALPSITFTHDKA